MKSRANKNVKASNRGKKTKDFRALSLRILKFANKAIPRVEFLREVSKILLEFSECDELELWLKKPERYVQCKITSQAEYSFIYRPIPMIKDEYGRLIPDLRDSSAIDGLRNRVLTRNFEPFQSMFTSVGSFWTADVADLSGRIFNSDLKESPESLGKKTEYKSLAMIPLTLGGEIIGLLQISGFKTEQCSEDWVHSFEDIAEIIAIALVNQRSRAALQERVKELTCLYSIARIAEKEELSQNEILQSIANLIPPAWQYPEIAASRIKLDDSIYTTADFDRGWQRQTADIVVKGKKRGSIEVVYTKLKPDLDEGPFLKEERSLLEVISRQIAMILERRESKEESHILHEQLRHADRLATIGQLASGVAHELNEPLGGILGFAQLLKKSEELSARTESDIDKIIDASLHAREVIKKLMFFAKQMPARVTKVQINDIVNDSLYFYKSRCAKAGIELVCDLHNDLPEITGDPSQLNQVLINLVVNSIQAMPAGGQLKIQTDYDNDNISLAVEDTGIGMSEDVMKKAFVPFFTTKDIDEGTGLGLAVVHGIVTAHKGRINIESEVGKGSRFVVRLPIA